MFTGIIKSLGTVKKITQKNGDYKIYFTGDKVNWSEISVGESIAVNGVCLTATQLHEDGFDADVSSETLKVTTFSDIKEDSLVNIEPSLSMGDKIGGHFVTGHIDCMAEIVNIKSDARSTSVDIKVPSKFARFIAAKGSICVDGVSLTVNSIASSTFNVYIIPHTASETIIGNYKLGDQVNIEVDMMARYLERLISKPSDGVITEEFLRDNGYE